MKDHVFSGPEFEEMNSGSGRIPTLSEARRKRDPRELEGWLQDHWFHTDGTPCSEYTAPKPLGDNGKKWLCTKHDMCVIWEPPLSTDESNAIIETLSGQPRVNPGARLEKWADVAMWRAPAHENPQHPVVTLSYAPEDPLGVMAMVNGQYTGIVHRTTATVTDEQRREAWEAGAVSQLSLAPLEWFQMSILFENVTRAFTHQLVRQRMAGYAQESMRFAVKDPHDSVKLPPSLAGTVSFDEHLANCEAAGVDPETNATQQQLWRNRWDQLVAQIGYHYSAMVDSGMPAEDARGLLPTNILTRIHMHVDMGTLLKLAGSRLCTQAQFEWREVFAMLSQAIREYVPEDHPNRWQFELIASRFRPVCFAAGKCVMKAKADRHCSIRAKVDAFEAAGIPSNGWESDGWVDANREPLDGIHPHEWLADPTAARVAPGQE